ncbi:putative C4-type zinc finger protein [Rhizobium phage RHph_TM40]|uniref:Putative C4-type zinc finger protein n=2 Tax=Cuauhnahuacvirus TaxID=3044696 RepID=A0A7S5RH82_9CAUD|nr:putative C4-type zinc finger protein [Rhizobium phage RHph_TM30]YP_010671390.1 putative C4-type zinc finger protein [Rhizobium phage RHph_Y65]QIG71712.1 putative C4-type zinc finger protein [Rhizobium phage RHph_TM40]QIG72075.1 putative C4-type zinc finger protein [Rhizobium phage RHph_TM2_3B]QIG72437.1 putative C4-type zinc finger protein [Rhizobium phage RHph_TM3_3_6]QIG77827.1 putative C4-type zinc finger protein [Rhizobium phage RHph_TM61]QIG71348.1 putative C4-type zinc finger protein
MFNELNIEVAQRVTDNHINTAIKRASAACAPQSSSRFDGIHCITCNEAIPARRLELGRIRCIDCQYDLEN